MDKHKKYRIYHPCKDCSKPVRSDHERCHPCYAKTMKVPKEISFWRHVQKEEGCWLWRGSLNWRGYGQCAGKGAHRISWEVHHGKIPTGLMICHKCDNPACVNPEHLFAATHQDNMDDRSKKLRHAFGEKHGMHKLTYGMIKFIRSSKLRTDELAKMFKVNCSTINRIKKEDSWNISHCEGSKFPAEP